MEDNMSSVTFSTDLDGDFSSLNLSDISPKKKIEKKSKRTLHFSDGTLEEYSSEEELEDKSAEDALSLVDPKTLAWAPWMRYWTSQTGKSMLSTCDYVGEGIANFLGITSQKYFYEIEEYKRSMQEEEETKQEEAAQMAGWTTGKSDLQDSNQLATEAEQILLKKNFEVNDFPPRAEQNLDENIKF